MRHSSTAIIIASYGFRGVLQTERQQLPYMLKGRRLRPVCGDQVIWTPSDNADEALVTDISPRRNTLARPDHRGKAEILAANLDTLAVVIAPEPAPDLFITDRFLCAAELMGASALLVWNKHDLSQPEPVELVEYEKLGYPVLKVSATTGAGMAELASTLRGSGDGTAMLVGQSGVGKSSIINQLLGSTVRLTRALSTVSREGRHTTTAAFAHHLHSGGLLIDSPGIRDFLPAIDDASLIQQGYPEIISLADQCRFADCTHTREPDCAVQAALAIDHISQRRYDSYKRLRNMSAQSTPKPR